LSRKKQSKGEPDAPGRYRPFANLDEIAPQGTPEPVPAPRPAPPVVNDEDEFGYVVADAVPLRGKQKVHAEKSPRPARLPDEGLEWQSFASELIQGEVDFDITWSDEYVQGRRHGVSPDTMKKLRRGKISWQGYLDLHGMNRDEARDAVERFIVDARRRNHGCVLIVHGRGKGSAGGVPVLKEKLVAWLTRDGGFGAGVLAFVTAQPMDGGPGSIYVLLRRT
jgi:DNA-nicking Smr family endonuclease